MFDKIIHKILSLHRREIPFIIFFSFLVTFILSRLTVYLINKDAVPDLLFFVDFIYIKGHHIHHFNIGIILLVIAGFFSLVDEARSHIRKIALLYGVGLALIMDEFGLLVTLDADAYWSRRSYDAIIVTALILLNITYFRRFWSVMGAAIKRHIKPPIK